MKKSEEAVRRYLEKIGLKYEYELLWKTKRPDFTLYSPNSKNEILGVIEVEDIDFNKEEMKVLNEKGFLSRSIDPYASIRKKIKVSRTQFKDSTEYPCILIVKNNAGGAILPIFTLGAMYGDITMNFPINTLSGHSTGKPYSSFGKRGRMRNPHTNKPINTTISAIGILNTVKPDNIISGYDKQLSKLIEKYDIDDEKQLKTFLAKGQQIEKKLRRKGFNLDFEEPELTFILNPHSRKPFPIGYFETGNTVIYSYNISTGEFLKTYDWKKYITK